MKFVPELREVSRIVFFLTLKIKSRLEEGRNKNMKKLSDKRNRELVAVLQKNILKLETTEEKLSESS